MQNKPAQEQTVQLLMEISRQLMGTGLNPENSSFIGAYLLYRAAQMDHPCTYEDVESNQIGLREPLRSMVGDKINSYAWERLEPLLARYASEDFRQALLQFDFSQVGVQADCMNTPESIRQLALKVLDIQPNSRVMDVCSGIGSFLKAAAQAAPEAEYFGCELNSMAKIIADIRMELAGAEAEIQQMNALSLLDSSYTEQFDRIFSNYPFGMKLRALGDGSRTLEKLMEEHPQLSKATSSDWIFNAVLCKLLAEDGKAVGVMTNGSTWNSTDEPIRQFFIESGFVEAVIALPPRMFSHTVIPTTMILFSRGNESVRMVDATQLCQEGRRINTLSAEHISSIAEALHRDGPYSRAFSRSELAANQFMLSPTRYLEEKIQPRYGVPFETVMKSISRGAPCTAKQLDEMVSDTETNMQYLMLGNIQDGIIDDRLPYLSYMDPKYEKYCLKDNSLILSKNGYPYKVAVARIPEGHQVLANGNLYIIELDEERVNPYYLKAFFESDLGIASLKRISVGATVPNLGVEQLKKLSVPVPPMEEQLRVAQRYQAALDEIAELNLRLQQATSRLHHVFDATEEE